jgi:ChrR-like protein with cupin domain
VSESASLPLFVREALEGEADADVGLERSLLALERALELPGSGAQHPETERFEAGSPANPGTEPTSGPPGVSTSELALPEAELLRSLARLEQAVSTPPYRYAPFFSRVAELFDLSEEQVAIELARLAEPSVWKFAGLPGISQVVVGGGARVKSAETLFVRFKPGLHFPHHQHTGLERVLVLEGSYEDSHGLVHRAGELREWQPGSDHAFKVSGEPCIFASVVFGRRFSAWPLRALSALLGR